MCSSLRNRTMFRQAVRDFCEKEITREYVGSATESGARLASSTTSLASKGGSGINIA